MQVVEQIFRDAQPATTAALRARSSATFPHAEACTFWKGRVALYAILKVLGIGAGDIVLVPGYTCFAVPSAVLFTGAAPLYVDIEPATFNVSLATIQKAYSHGNTSRVKAVLVQHTYGLPVDLFPILPWAREHGIPIIEDCAHAIGSCYLDQYGTWHEVGTLGDAAFFSSQWTKPVSTGLGGWGYMADPALQQGLYDFVERECVKPGSWESFLLAAQVCARSVFSSSFLYWLARSIYQDLYRRGVLVGTSSEAEFRAEQPSEYAKRMSGFQQWLLQRRLASTSIQAHRRKLKKVYEAALVQAGIATLQVPQYADPVLLRYPVRVACKGRMMRDAKRRRIELGDWYNHPVDVPDSTSPELFGYHAGMCSEGERAAREVVNLPMHSGISEHSVARIVSFIKEFA